MNLQKSVFSRLCNQAWCLWPRRISASARLSSTKVKRRREPRAAAREVKSSAADVQSSSNGKDDAFYVVQKGGITGVYKNFEDCRSMVSDPACSVYKGRSLERKTEELLASLGMKNASYSISSMDLLVNFFGALDRYRDAEDTAPVELKPDSLPPLAEHEHAFKSTAVLEFDGSSKGNPGIGGAGAILRSADGKVIYRLREGLGIVTNNVAEYKAVILGLRFALKKGISQIRIQGDSKLVCMQIQNLWKAKAKHVVDLSNEAKELKEKFSSFEALNTEADSLANSAAKLQSGEVHVWHDQTTDPL
ncbi:Uncharacterized protein EJ110_NYTH44701 [Nymphaea thermarum]|nr:Uncharacterized protein EJ110_NYTH44701 [Nymphaea thermarum]